jgi:hypothetical protein
MDLSQEQINHQLREQAEHQHVMLAIRDVLATPSGKIFIKYLLKSFEVGEMPEIGLPHDILLDKLGFLRAGNSVFKIIAEANNVEAGAILGQIEKEKYEDSL